MQVNGHLQGASVMGVCMLLVVFVRGVLGGMIGLGGGLKVINGWGLG